MNSTDDERTYTLRQAANAIGRSVAWLRQDRNARLRAVGAERTGPKRSYRLTPLQVEQLRGMAKPRGTGARATGAALASELAVRDEQITTLQASLVAADRNATDLRDRLTAAEQRVQDERAERLALQGELRETQRRVEALKGLTWLDRLRGKQRDV